MFFLMKVKFYSLYFARLHKLQGVCKDLIIKVKERDDQNAELSDQND